MSAFAFKLFTVANLCYRINISIWATAHPPTPPLTQQQSIDNKSGLILG